MHIRDAVESVLNAEEAKQFAKWAFGDDYLNHRYGLDFMDAWNRLHGEELKLYANTAISEDVPKMVEVWRGVKNE